MPPTAAPFVPVPAPSTDLASFRAVLDGANFTAPGIAAALGLPVENLGFRAAELPLLERRLDAGDSGRLPSLIKLFVLGCAIPIAEAAGAVHPLELAEPASLLQVTAGAVRSPLRLTPYDGFVFAHDPHEPAPLFADHVLGVGPASRTLAEVTVRRPVARALDIGTGCGVQALLATRHAEQVTAVDLNPRALNLAELNARLNGVRTVEWREGSLCEPVAGARFDLVVANPPFVISPDARYVFRDGGRPGDSLSRTVVAQASGMLHEGGFAHVLCNWAHRRDQEWWEPLGEWVSGSGCDAWLLHSQSQDPLTYAAHWNRELQATAPDAYAEALDRWQAYYRRAGIEAIASGAVILRRRVASRNWIRWAEMPRAPTGSAGAHVQRLFAAQDVLAALPDDGALMAEVFHLVEGHRLTQRLLYRGGRYAIADVTMVMEPGLGLDQVIPAAVVPVLLQLDGQRPLAQVVADVALEAELSVDSLRSATAPVVSELFRHGLIGAACRGETTSRMTCTNRKPTTLRNS
jgi:methylase of polypeptide subunit release factors